MFKLEDGVTFPGEHDNIINPPESKVPIYVKYFDAGYRILMSEFFREVLCHHKVHINMLVPNGPIKVDAFEMLCQDH